MNKQKVKQIVLIDEIIHKFYELQSEIIKDNLNKNTHLFYFNKDIDTIRDMFCKAVSLYIDKDKRNKVLELNSEINTYQNIVDKLDGFDFTINSSCQEYYESLLNQCKLGLEYKKQELNNL